MCWAWSTLLCPKLWGHDSPPLPNLFFLKKKHSRVLRIWSSCRRTGAWIHVQKGWLATSSQLVNFLQNKKFQGPIAYISPPSVRIPSHITYQTKLCLDPIFSTISIQTLESTIKIYHHMKWHSFYGNHTTAPKTRNSQCKVGNMLDFPTQHKVPYVLDAHQHWISQWCFCKDIGVSPMSSPNYYRNHPTNKDSQTAHNKMMHHNHLQKCKLEKQIISIPSSHLIRD